jgi:Spy/CpxP family protein refolding chaperone
MSICKVITCTATAAILALATAAAAAGEPPSGPPGEGRRGPGGGPPPGGLGDLRLLDLSQEQEVAVGELMRQHRASIQPLVETQRARMRQIHELAVTPGADPAAIGRLVIEAEAARQQMDAERDKLKEAVTALLTPEQRELRARLDAAHKKASERMRARGEGFGPGLGGEEFGPGGGFFGRLGEPGE